MATEQKPIEKMSYVELIKEAKERKVKFVGVTLADLKKKIKADREAKGDEIMELVLGKGEKAEAETPTEVKEESNESVNQEEEQTEMKAKKKKTAKAPTKKAAKKPAVKKEKKEVQTEAPKVAIKDLDAKKIIDSDLSANIKIVLLSKTRMEADKINEKLKINYSKTFLWDFETNNSHRLPKYLKKYSEAIAK